MTAPPPPFSGSYAPADVTFLLKPVSLAATDVQAKERLIQSGRRHYSEMISAEAPPDPAYLQLYREALARNGARLAHDVASLAASLARRLGEGEIVLASLARAGTPIGILLRRALLRLGVEAPHYSISIIRDRGVDPAALAHIAARHDPRRTVFVDGWTGKGAIAGELHRSLAGRPHGFEPRLAVVADPAGRADFAATDEDYLIASGLLNAVVSGLLSRSILNDQVVGPGDFHACVHYSEFAPHDVSRAFIEAVDALAPCGAAAPAVWTQERRSAAAARCDAFVDGLLERHGIADRNRIKPGIAEATRALLRRVPERLLLRDASDEDVRHLVHLAGEKGVAVSPLPGDAPFRAVTVIRGLGIEGAGAWT